MAITTAGGKTWANGDIANSTNLNSIVNSMTVSLATDKLIGRTTASTGSWEEVTCTDWAQTMLAATSSATARTVVGISLSATNSSLANSSGVTQTGTLGNSVIFNTTNAPSVALTAGTWFLSGSVGVRSNDTAVNAYGQFYNSTTTTAFGGGAAATLGTTPASSLPVSGYISVASSETVVFQVSQAGGATLVVGSSNSPAGFIQAIKLTAS